MQIDFDSAFDRLSATLGEEMTVFVLCAAADMCYSPGTGATTWEEYREALGERNGLGFAQGETDVNEAILAGADQAERWKVVWGDRYSETEYRQLDDLYHTMTAQLDANGGVIDKMQEDTARTCARMALNRNKLVDSSNKDDIAVAKSLDEMIRKNLQDCNMRKADVLPTQKQRIDGFVDALKRKTGLGPSMTREEVLEAFYRWCKKKKYPMTTDAADHLLFGILRVMAKNNDEAEPIGLPPELRFDDYAGEFAPEPNEQERDTYQYLKLSRGAFRGEDEQEG